MGATGAAGVAFASGGGGLAAGACGVVVGVFVRAGVAAGASTAAGPWGTGSDAEALAGRLAMVAAGAGAGLDSGPGAAEAGSAAGAEGEALSAAGSVAPVSEASWGPAWGPDGLFRPGRGGVGLGLVAVLALYNSAEAFSVGPGMSTHCSGAAASIHKWARPTPAINARATGQVGPLRLGVEALSLGFESTIKALIVLSCRALCPFEP